MIDEEGIFWEVSASGCCWFPSWRYLWEEWEGLGSQSKGFSHGVIDGGL